MRTWFILKVRGHYFKGFSPKNGKPIYTPDKNKALKMGKITAHRQRNGLRGGNLMTVEPFAITCSDMIPSEYL